MSMPITEHFSLGEFESHDSVPYPAEWISPRLVPLCELLEQIRYGCGDKPVEVVSGFRTLEHNTAVGGEENSYHMKGMAADIRIADVPAALVHMTIMRLYRAGKLPMLGGLGKYLASNFCHIDIRGFGANERLAQWCGKGLI